MNNNDEIIQKMLEVFPRSSYKEEKRLFKIKKNNHTEIAVIYINKKDTLKIIKARLIERLVPVIVNYNGYSAKWRNDDVKEEIKQGLNNFLGTNFTYEDFRLINQSLGNGINRRLTIKFVCSDCDLNILK